MLMQREACVNGSGLTRFATSAHILRTPTGAAANICFATLGCEDVVRAKLQNQISGRML